jgi:hypothetical protein
MEPDLNERFFNKTQVPLQNEQQSTLKVDYVKRFLIVNKFFRSLLFLLDLGVYLLINGL